MRVINAKKQTIMLTGVNAVVRALGLWMRVLLSRALGAELMGVIELGSSVHILAITPLTSGLPLAVSRLTARASEQRKHQPLQNALLIVRRFTCFAVPLMLVLSPWIAHLSNDVRILPSLWFTAPCILVLGYSASFNGYCYGTDRAWISAISELIEQVARFALSLGLIALLKHLTAGWMAAVPVAATLAAEIMGLIFVMFVLRLPSEGHWDTDTGKALLRLSAPATATRLINTGLRSVTAILIPVRLQACGMLQPEATAQLGMFNGMLLPILMLPCIFTSALSMVMLPRFAKAEQDPPQLRRLLITVYASSGAIGALCAIGLFAVAPFLALTIFRTAELTALFRSSAPLCLVMSLCHVSAGMMAGLGKQKSAMYGTLSASVVSLFLTYLCVPAMRLKGAILALGAGQIIQLLWNLCSLPSILREARRYDRCA